MTGPESAAFFDVDETLISIKSMFRFLGFFFAELGRPPADAETAQDELGRLAARGVPREETNRRYYRHLQGHRVDDVARIGRAWFEAESADPGLFHRPVVGRLEAHRRAGDLIVLVSGSFSACLDPIRDALGADVAAGTTPRVVGGRYTGGVEGQPVIGPGKDATVRAVAARHGIDRARSWAYADHASDLQLLRCVGHPVVVGADPVLLGHAREERWPVIDPRDAVAAAPP